MLLDSGCSLFGPVCSIGFGIEFAAFALINNSEQPDVVFESLPKTNPDRKYK